MLSVYIVIWQVKIFHSIAKSENLLLITWSHKLYLLLTLIEPVYDIFVLRFRPKKQQFSVALPEVFKSSNGSASLVDCTRKKKFFGWGVWIFVTDIISEVVLGSFWLMLPGLEPTARPKCFAEVFCGN